MITFVAGCPSQPTDTNSKAVSASDRDAFQGYSYSSGASSAAPSPEQVQAAVDQQQQQIAVPKGARWTLACKTFSGPTHQHDAAVTKQQWMGKSGLTSWYVVHGEQESTLYYGYYRSFNDPKDLDETHRALADQKKIESLANGFGDHVFQTVIFVEMATADPVAPREWNIVNSPGHFTLVIATYMGDVNRKQLAVDAVRDARSRGIEAYYYHDETASNVCIGSWPAEAVRTQEAPSASSADPRQPIMVSNAALPPEIASRLRDKNGNKIKVMAPRIDPVDPGLIKTMRDFPLYSFNGNEVVDVRTDSSTGKKVRIPRATYLAEIKRPGD